MVSRMSRGEGMLNCFSHAWLFVTLWTVAWQAPLSMRFSRQEYWNGLPFSSRIFPTQGPNSHLLMSPALAGGSLVVAPPGKTRVELVGANFWYNFMQNKENFLMQWMCRKRMDDAMDMEDEFVRRRRAKKNLWKNQITLWDEKDNRKS